MFWYWVCVASVGNLIDYVPIRTFTDATDLYQDMYAVERGFGWYCVRDPDGNRSRVFHFSH